MLPLPQKTPVAELRPPSETQCKQTSLRVQCASPRETYLVCAPVGGFQGPYDTVSDTRVKLFIYAVRHMLCLHMTSTYVALVKGHLIM